MTKTMTAEMEALFGKKPEFANKTKTLGYVFKWRTSNPDALAATFQKRLKDANRSDLRIVVRTPGGIGRFAPLSSVSVYGYKKAL